MNIQEDRRGNILILRVCDRVHAAVANELETLVMEKIEQDEKFIAFDFAKMDFISSSGLRVLLMVAKKMKKLDGHVALFAMNENIREVFKISGFDALFSIYSNEEDAIRSFL